MTFLLWLHVLLLFIPLPFLCSVFRLSSALFLICAAFALSAFFFSFSMVPSAAASFSAIYSRAFSTSLKSHSIPLSLSSSFISALNFSLRSVYLSLKARLLTLDRGNLRPFRLLAIFPRFAFRKASFLLLKEFKL